MKQVDLHVHSTYSDGTDTPKELVKKAALKGLSAIALTDHDTVEGVCEALQAGLEYGVEVIPGVELSTSFGNSEVHIVGLFINYNDSSLQSRHSQLKDTRINRNRIMCERFLDYNIEVSYDEMLSMYPDSVITRAHFADYLLKKGYIKSRNEAFERFIGDHGPCYVPREKISPNEAIQLIKQSGGVAVLAHPVLYHLGNDRMNELINLLCDAGLDGIEAIYSTYSLGDELSVRNIASKYNLLISGGSDYHGKNKPDIELGAGRGRLFVPYEVLSNLRNAASSNI